MNKTLIALALVNEYLKLLDKEIKDYSRILDELSEKITNEPSIHRKQVLENQRKLIAEEALMLYEVAMSDDAILSYISKRIG